MYFDNTWHHIFIKDYHDRTVDLSYPLTKAE